MAAQSTNIEPLRLFFFTDWRLQPLELAEALLDVAGPVDLILYGGDDVGRFDPPPVIPEAVAAWVLEQHLWTSLPGVGPSVPTRNYHRITVRAAEAAEEIIAYGAQVLGRQPLRELGPKRYPSLGDIFELFREPGEDNRLRRMAGKARFGIGAVIGNDDYPPRARHALQCAGVRDLHAAPTAFGGWGFIGIEGAIYRKNINKIGTVLHSEQEVRQHLKGATEALQIPPHRLVLVSHTPPADCGLDIGIRFGFEHLGSPALTGFVRKTEPALVLCGHCHSRGGKSAWLGKTLVINGASDDRDVRRARAAVIELAPDRPPVLTWLDPTPHSVVFVPGIGAVAAEKLAAAGITRPAQIFDADDATLKSIHFGEGRQRKLVAYRLAVEQNVPFWLPGPASPLPEELLFYDVETGLNLGQQQEPWMIGALGAASDHVEQWVAPDETPTARRRMYTQFLAYVRGHPKATLCSWSGTKFDQRAVMAGLAHWCPEFVEEWTGVPQLDLLTFVKPRLVLPTPDWTLKSVAPWCGYAELASVADLDGFEVGLRYEEYRTWGTPLPIEAIKQYNIVDVLTLAHVARWAHEHMPK